MSFVDTPMTKLEAVNMVLRGVGQDVVETLDEDWPDVQSASKLVDDISRALQIKGWSWNKRKFTFTPDENGFIFLPNNYISIFVEDHRNYTHVVERGMKLFDIDNDTFVFTTALTLHLYVLVPFEEFPLSVKEYIGCSAAVQHQQNVLGDDGIDKGLKERMQQSFLLMTRQENMEAKPNAVTDNMSVQAILHRKRRMKGVV